MSLSSFFIIIYRAGKLGFIEMTVEESLCLKGKKLHGFSTAKIEITQPCFAERFVTGKRIITDRICKNSMADLLLKFIQIQLETLASDTMKQVFYLVFP